MRTRKRFAIALFASIAINLFLAGMLATVLIRDDRDGAKPRFGRFDRAAAMATLSDDSRARVEQIWREKSRAVRVAAKTRRQLRQQMREMLISDNFDKARYDALSSEYHAKSSAMRHNLQQVIAEIAAALPADQRQAYFKAGMPKRKKPQQN